MAKEHRYRGSRLRGSVYTGLPGIPKRLIIHGHKVNIHDHSATSHKANVGWEQNGIAVSPPVSKRQRRGE